MCVRFEVILEELVKNAFKYSAIVTEVQIRCEGLSCFLSPIFLKQIIDGFISRKLIAPK